MHGPLSDELGSKKTPRLRRFPPPEHPFVVIVSIGARESLRAGACSSRTRVTAGNLHHSTSCFGMYPCRARGIEPPQPFLDWLTQRRRLRYLSSYSTSSHQSLASRNEFQTPLKWISTLSTESRYGPAKPSAFVFEDGTKLRSRLIYCSSRQDRDRGCCASMHFCPPAHPPPPERFMHFRGRRYLRAGDSGVGEARTGVLRRVKNLFCHPHLCMSPRMHKRLDSPDRAIVAGSDCNQDPRSW